MRTLLYKLKHEDIEYSYLSLYQNQLQKIFDGDVVCNCFASNIVDINLLQCNEAYTRSIVENLEEDKLCEVLIWDASYTVNTDAHIYPKISLFLGRNIFFTR